MIISIYTEKAFDEIKYPFVLIIQQIRYSWKTPQYNKGHNDKPTATIMLNSEKLKKFPPWLGIR